ncbi:MAG TPA: hypothetical protein VF179_24880 [Thermoanaerobaculia bacterium]|nr:hypothetical protein [Thermoanaerobaculia bacterium]
MELAVANTLSELIVKYVPGGTDELEVLKGSQGVRFLERFMELPEEPLTITHINQFLHLSHQPGISEGFFRYYFLERPSGHPYNLDAVLAETPDLHPSGIHSLEHLEWGVRRFIFDALLYFGDLSTAYSELAHLSFESLVGYFRSFAFNADAMKRRGPFMEFESIPIDDRYLIAELACKAYDLVGGQERSMVTEHLLEAYSGVPERKRGGITIRKLLEGPILKGQSPQDQLALKFSVDEIVDDPISSEEDLADKVKLIAERFSRARERALANTNLYLSLANDMDIYVATSMRTRQDFREMASTCAHIFNDNKLRSYHLRYFDPTISACKGHEDKGIIECLMVKCSKVLVYFAGEKESFGKDSEAAMALSQGKPVIIVCPNTEAGVERMRFFRDVHPLSRMIQMTTGVSVGAMITTSIDNVVTLLQRIFNNDMEYELEHDGNGHYRLREKLTQSVVRLQTGSKLLRETFWNYYHGLPAR